MQLSLPHGLPRGVEFDIGPVMVEFADVEELVLVVGFLAVLLSASSDIAADTTRWKFLTISLAAKFSAAPTGFCRASCSASLLWELLRPATWFSILLSCLDLLLRSSMEIPFLVFPPLPGSLFPASASAPCTVGLGGDISLGLLPSFSAAAGLGEVAFLLLSFNSFY